MIPLRLKKDGWFSYGLEIKGKLYEFMGCLRIHPVTSTRMYWETDDAKQERKPDISRRQQEGE
jgi:hypothetical protein